MLICDICGRKLDPDDPSTYDDKLCTTHYINGDDEDMYDETDVSLCEKCHKHIVRTRKNAIQQAEMKIYQNRNVKVEDGKAVINDTAYYIDALKCPNCFKNVSLGDEVCKHCGCVLTPNVITKQEKCCDNLQKGMETCTEKTLFLRYFRGHFAGQKCPLVKLKVAKTVKLVKIG